MNKMPSAAFINMLVWEVLHFHLNLQQNQKERKKTTTLVADMIEFFFFAFEILDFKSNWSVQDWG